jgi:hypothetical protein
MACREQVGRLFAHGKPVEKKQLSRKCVEEMKLAPERLEVEITYRVPEPVMNSVVAGARFLIYPRPPSGSRLPPSGRQFVPFIWCRDGVFDAANP